MSARAGDWISGREAARILGIDNHHVPRLAGQGLITTRSIPGCKPRYLRSDVKELAARSTKHRKAAAGPGASPTHLDPSDHRPADFDPPETFGV